MGFLTRYRPFPEALFLEASRDHPLLQTRQPDDEALPPLEQMLRHPSIELHAQMAKVLEASASLDEGRAAVLELHSCLPEPREDDARSFAISEVAG